jgi:hypothetical protein
MIKINLSSYGLEKAEEKKHDYEIGEVKPYKSKGIPVIESRDTKYVGGDGNSVLGWTIPGDRIVLHDDVIEKMSYALGMDPAELKEEVLQHEKMHNWNPYASEAANREATAHLRYNSGKPLSALHSAYCAN